MYELIIQIFIIIGAVVSIIGSCFIVVFGGMVLYDLINTTYNEFNFKLLKQEFKTEKKLYIMEQLDGLKERYPDLEINYKFKK